MMLEICNAAPPVLVRVRVLGALVSPMRTPPNKKLLAERVATALPRLISHTPRPWVEARRIRAGLSRANPRTATRGKPLIKVNQFTPSFVV